MNENTNSPKAPHRLTNTELEAVAGGNGIWSSRYEAAYQREYRDSGSTDSFDNWFREKTIADFNRGGIALSARDLANLDDAFKAREFWLADGGVDNKTYYCSDGALSRIV